MNYYFNTYYVNFAISTEYSLYAYFKPSCKEISSKLANEVVCYGERRLNQEQYWQTEYWKHFYEKNYNLIGCNEMLKKVQTIDSNDIILTGAGLSKAAGIPTQVELEEGLFLHDIEKLYLHCTQNPIYLIKKFRLFYLCLSYANPTKAHYAIKRIWNQTNCVVITENLDLLHEKTGTNVVRAQCASEFLANMKPNRRSEEHTSELQSH